MPRPETQRDYFAELYVAAVFGDAGWSVYFPKRDVGFDFIVSKAVKSAVILHPVQVKGLYPPRLRRSGGPSASTLGVMNRSWLRQRYRRLPPLAQRTLIYGHLRNDIAVLRKVCRRFPRIYALRHSLTDALLRANRKSEARHVWLETVRSFPRAPNPYFQLATWAFDHGAFGEAAQRLKQCLALDRGYFRETAHFWRAEALYRVRRFDEAIAELSHVSSSYEEFGLSGYCSRSKTELLNDIAQARGE